MNIEEKTALNIKIAGIIYPNEDIKSLEAHHGYVCIGESQYLTDYLAPCSTIELMALGVSVMHPDYSGGAGYKAVALTPACGLVEVFDDDLATAVALCFAEANDIKA